MSNPPYVAEGDPALAALAHEPALGARGRRPTVTPTFSPSPPRSREHLKPGGLLLLEHGAGQAPALQAELVRLGYARVVSHRDLAGLDRVTEAFWFNTT